MTVSPISEPLSQVRRFNKREETNVKYLHVILASAVMACVLVGCDGDDEAQNVPVTPPAAPGTPAATTDFLTFVRQLLASTAENTNPVPVNSPSFTNLLAAGDPQPITFFRP